MAFSTTTRRRDNSVFSSFCRAVSGWFFVALWGIKTFAPETFFPSPKNPKSTCVSNREKSSPAKISLKIAKSCVCPS